MAFEKEKPKQLETRIVYPPPPIEPVGCTPRLPSRPERDSSSGSEKVPPSTAPSAYDAQITRAQSQLDSAVAKLQKHFAGLLWDAKVNSCFSACHAIEKTKSVKKKRAILDEKAREWREGSVKAIRTWLPKFMELAEAYSDVLGEDTLRWTEDRVWKKVEAQCEIRRQSIGESSRAVRLSTSMLYWFAVASTGDMEVNARFSGRQGSLAGYAEIVVTLCRKRTIFTPINLQKKQNRCPEINSGQKTSSLSQRRFDEYLWGRPLPEMVCGHCSPSSKTLLRFITTLKERR